LYKIVAGHSCIEHADFLAVFRHLMCYLSWKRFVTIQCNVRGRDIGSFVTEARREVEARVDIPPEYFLTWGGQFQDHGSHSVDLAMWWAGSASSSAPWRARS